jgi:hypothetical protein
MNNSRESKKSNKAKRIDFLKNKWRGKKFDEKKNGSKKLS